MSAASGFVMGALALTALEAVGGSNFATGSIGAGFTAAAAVIRRWSDPDVPAIPDLRGSLLARVGDTLGDAGLGTTDSYDAGGAHPSAATTKGNTRGALSRHTKIPANVYTTKSRVVSA